MNPILQALNSGYSANQIIGFISKAIPQMAPAIKQAQRVGYPTNQILGFLSKNFEKEDRTGLSESERHAVNKRADADRAKFGLKAAAGIALSPIAAQVVGNTIARALPSSLQSGATGSPPTTPPLNPGGGNPSPPALAPTSPQGPQQGQLQTTSPSPQPPIANLTPNVAPNMAQPNIATNLPQQGNAAQPQGISNPKEILEGMGILAKVDEELKKGNTPEVIPALLGEFKGKKVAQGNSDPELTKVIQEYAKTKPAESPVKMDIAPITNLLPESTESVTNPQLQTKDEQSSPEKNTKIEKASIVATPLGVGEVREIRNGQAIVNVDGKLHKVKEEDLISSPVSKEALAQLHDDLISGIESHTGQEISKNVEWAGYDPKTNELAYKPHGNDIWVYEDISPEDAQLLTSFLTQRKTSGENYMGAWEKGTKSPIGAAMSALIKRLQSERGGKGNEYRNRFNTIYDALEPAKKAKKEVHAEEKRKQRKKKA